jgi:hypothetical protein
MADLGEIEPQELQQPDRLDWMAVSIGERNTYL